MRLKTWISAALIALSPTVQAAEPSVQAAAVRLQDVVHYTHDGAGPYPKYSGALGFGYPSQSGKQAVRSPSGQLYYTFSKCVYSAGIQQYLVVSVADGKGNKTVVRRVQGYCDPHENASVYVDSDGYITVAQSSRGDWRKGYIFKSINPNDISAFSQVASGYYAYPKPVSFGLVYTKYEGYFRTTRVRLNNGTDYQLVNAPGYSLAYQDASGTVHVVYDYHVDGDLDRRVNVYYMKSDDGVNWFNRYGEPVSLPVAANSDATRIGDDDRSCFSYIKDLSVIDGEVKILVTHSDSNLPEKGHRDLFIHSLDGSAVKVTPVGHNYDGASFYNGGVVATISDEFPYAGGGLHYFNTDGSLQWVYRGLGAANHPTVAGNSILFGDATSSRVYDGSAGLYVITP